MSERNAAVFVLALVCTLCAAAAQPRPDRFMPFLCRNATVLETGEPTCLVSRNFAQIPTVVIGRDSPGPRRGFEDSQIRRAGTTLISYLEKITGVKCSWTAPGRKPPDAATVRFHIGAAGNPFEKFPELREADAHGFLIKVETTAGGTDVHIVGASGTSTLYASWFFLMNYAGLRLVMPQEIGEVYPKLDRLEVPAELYVLNPTPDYLLRIWSGNGGFDNGAWLADSGATQRFQYHHNMTEIYPPEKFGESNPEFYPVREGKPFIPTTKAAWQPTFSEPAVAQRAIQYAGELFTERPDMKSISLSVNDGLGYSEADIRKGAVLPDGSASISNIYYLYVNTVARGIKQKWPDKYVAFFPYNLVRQPPEFALADNVILFLLNEPKTTYKAWTGKVQHIGIYQWLYGIGWVLPNHWPHAMQDYLRWTRNHGAKAFKGEAYVAWAQGGAKMWVLNNLLWNVDADVDAILRDYYEHAFGPEAAPAVARFFAQVEEIYERRRTAEEYRIARWNPGEYQFEHAESADFAAMRQALDDALAAVQGEANGKRLDMLMRCFRWCELFWEQYAAMLELENAGVRTEEDVLRVLDAALRFHTLPGERDAFRKEQIEPMAQFCVHSQKADEVDWSRAEPAFKWSDLDAAIDRGFGAISAFRTRTLSVPQTADYWLEIGKKDSLLKPFTETQRLLLLHPEDEMRNILTNPSFEELPSTPTDDKDKGRPYAAEDWPVYHNRMVSARVFLDDTVARTGKRSLSAVGITDYSGLIRRVRLRNRARYRLAFWYRTTATTRHISRVIMCRPRIREHLPPSEEWTEAGRIFTVDMPGGNEANVSILLCLRHGSSDGSQVWFDDVRLELLAPDGVAAGSEGKGE